MYFRSLLTASLYFICICVHAQFAPGPGVPGSTAIYKDSSAISFWADSVVIQRGWKDISDTAIGKVTLGHPSNAVSKADGGIVSLGDGGIATLYFPYPIYNVDGFDFAVFENGFAATGGEINHYFLELAFVEVSENGIDFVRFPPTSYVPVTSQIPSYGTIDCRLIHHFAGKYPLFYGTPFDIEEIGIDSIVSIRLIDAIGSIDTLSTYDQYGTPVNDPFPTPFSSSGFDLDAVAAIHQPYSIHTDISSIRYKEFNDILVYPNPSHLGGTITISLEGIYSIIVYDLRGKICGTFDGYNKTKIHTKNWASGTYQILIQHVDGTLFFERISVL